MSRKVGTSPTRQARAARPDAGGIRRRVVGHRADHPALRPLHDQGRLAEPEVDRADRRLTERALSLAAMPASLIAREAGRRRKRSLRRVTSRRMPARGPGCSGSLHPRESASPQTFHRAGDPCPDLPLRTSPRRSATFTAVDDVNLTVPHGTFVCLLGPSGCGKTTLVAHDRRPRRADRRRDPARRRRHHAGADAQAQSRHGVPVAGAVSASVRRRQHRLSAAHPRRAQGRAEEARRRAARR